MRQCELLDLCRSSLYYRPRPVSPADLPLMRRIDELHLAHPFLGARRLARVLQREGFEVGRRQVGTLVRLMGIEAIYRKRRTSTPGRATRSTRICSATSPSSGPIRCGPLTSPSADGAGLCLSGGHHGPLQPEGARLPGEQRHGGDFCVEAVQEALARYGPPEIFNTDQGAQFTAAEFTAVLLAKDVRVSMDGKGRWEDNIFVERLWRTSNTSRSTSTPTRRCAS